MLYRNFHRFPKYSKFVVWNNLDSLFTEFTETYGAREGTCRKFSCMVPLLVRDSISC